MDPTTCIAEVAGIPMSPQGEVNSAPRLGSARGDRITRRRHLGRKWTGMPD